MTTKNWENRLRAELDAERGQRSLRQLALDIGVHPATLYRFMAGERSASHTLLDALVTAAPDTLRRVFGGEDSVSPEDAARAAIWQALGEQVAVVFLPADSPVGDEDEGDG